MDKDYIHSSPRFHMDDSDATSSLPSFEDPFSGDDVEQQIYGTVLQLREPKTAGKIAEQVGCDPKTARKYLRWFAKLGIVIHHEDHPNSYERNNGYFEWRRINQLAHINSYEALQQRVRELTETISAYEQTYDASTPKGVDAVAVVEGDATTTVDAVYSDLNDWETARRERRRYERARQQQAGASDHERVSG